MQRHPATLLTIFLFTSIIPLLPAAPPEVEHGRKFPEVQIPGHARGPEIIQSLGNRLPEVARWYGSSAEEFRAAIGHDHSVHSDADGLLYYVCAGAEAEGAVADSISSEELAAGADAFALHSRPGAPLVIHLDFDGHITSQTSWNGSYNGGNAFSTPPYDTDGNSGSFSTAERNAIAQIWARVTEDFAPWDVDVTTEDPGPNDLARVNSSDAYYGIRVCIGGSSTDWFGSSAGGVAYIGSFTWNSDTPCFVFENQLGNGNVKYTAEAISHEVGHTFALYHDGTTTGSAYYQGHGNWAPIMGVGYYKGITQWSRGDYANANNTQDDVGLITDRVPLRPDLAGDDISTLAIMPTGVISGIIETPDDADLFRFETDGGWVEFIASNFGNQPNLDMMLVLYDGFGSPLATADPAGLTASLNVNVAAGSYFIGIEGVGTGDPTTGYNAYGSLGEFELSGSFSTSSNQAPVADASGSGPVSGRAPLSVNFSSAGSYDPDGSIASYDWDFDDGAQSAASAPSHTFTTPGTYLVSLVVTDDQGATGNDLVTIVVSAPQPPIAVISTGGSLTGFGPLEVNFDGSGSDDPDGVILAFDWDFGDGSVATGALVNHTFVVPGVYAVELTVTDDEGLTATDSVTVTVQDVTALPVVLIGDITLSISGNSRKGYQATAKVEVVDEGGRALRNAEVTGVWSGVVSGTASGTSSRKGSVSLRSPKTRSSGGVSFELTGIVLDGYRFDSDGGADPVVSAVIP